MSKRIIKRNSPTIKNAHLIGAGAKFTPVYTNKGKINWRGSVIKQNGSHSVPKYSKAVTKKPVRQISTSFKTSFKAHQLKQPQQTIVKAKDVRLKGLEKMRAKMPKTPSPKMTMKSRTPVKKKPPTKGRGR